MSQSLVCQYTHFVFSTKNRWKLIRPSFEGELHTVFEAILQKLDCSLIKAGGVSDHRHVLARVHQCRCAAEIVQKLKSNSCGWVRRELGKKKFGWQNGYAAFSVSKSRVPEVVRYIRSQKEHHRRVSFKDELRRILTAHGVEFDERYLWD